MEGDLTTSLSTGAPGTVKKSVDLEKGGGSSDFGIEYAGKSRLVLY